MPLPCCSMLARRCPASPYQLRSLLCLAVACQFTGLPRKALSSPVITFPLLAPLFRFSSRCFVSPRRHAISTHRRSVPFVAARIRFDSVRLVYHRRHAVSPRFICRRCHALSAHRRWVPFVAAHMQSVSNHLPSCPGFAVSVLCACVRRHSSPLPFRSEPCPAVQCLRQSFLVAAMPFRVNASPLVPFMAIPSLCWFRSDLCAYARRVSISAPCSTCPSISMSFRLVSSPFSSSAIRIVVLPFDSIS